MEKWLAILDECSGISTDSRNVFNDCLYIALKGANFDGNQFAQAAIDSGAKFAVVDDPSVANELDIFYVPDGLAFLQNLAHAHRLRFQIPVIGITGSNGKTSTKELVNCVLSAQFKVLCTVGNLNNHIGVPLTLLQLNQDHEIAIIEMGANKLKDIDELCSIAAPTHGVITNIGKAHLEGFINFEGVLRTKSELYDHVNQNKGVLFVNADDPVLMEAANSRSIEIKSYGEKNGQLRGKLAYLDPYVHLTWRCENYESVVIDTQMIGKYNFYNFLAALCIGYHFDIDPQKMNAAIANYVPTNKRSQVEKTENNTVIIDCYNANPSSMQSALSSFLEIKHPHKVAILGDMLELGAEGPIEHQKILDYLTTHDLNFITVGEIFQRINKDGYNDVAALAEVLEKQKIRDQLILLKGSRGIALEQLLRYL
jgi:UDP-N-acetylmuramoyl-tripeptide--D-alanyl-D-alanine ligase